MWGGAVRKLCAVPQTRKQSICVRHEDLIENTKSWLVEFQEQFRLKTKPNFPIEVLTSLVTTDLIKCISQLHLTCPSSAATFAIKVLSGRAITGAAKHPTEHFSACTCLAWLLMQQA